MAEIPVKIYCAGYLTHRPAIQSGSSPIMTMQATHQGELMGVPGTGKQLANTGTTIYGLAGANFVGIRNFADNLGLMQQLVIVPTPAP